MVDVRELASGLRQSRVGSSARSHLPKFPIKLENTYRLHPEKDISFTNLRNIIKEIFESMLDGKKYDEEECSRQAKLLSDMVKDRVKSLGYSRYKVIAVVAIGQTRASTLNYCSRFVWNESFDTYAEYAYKSADLYAVGTVYAVYVE